MKTILSSLAFAALSAAASAQDSTNTAPADARPAPAETIPAPDKPKGSAILKVYGEWFYDFSDNVSKTSGFDLTRAYLGYKQEFSGNVSGNVTVDVGRINPVTKVTATTTAGNVTAVSTSADTRYDAFLKTAALTWKNIAPITTVDFGQVGTNAFATQEAFWAYRFVYPSFMDQNGFASSADLGAKLTVKPSDLIAVHAELLNGEGYKAPQDAQGDYRSSVSADLALPVGLKAMAYYDYMPNRNLDATSTLSGFLGYEMKDMFRLGGEYDYQMAKGGVTDHDWSGFSLYGYYILGKDVQIFARFDMLSSNDDWNKAGTDGNTAIGGVKYSPAKGVDLAADVQSYQPAADGADAQTKAKLNIQYAL
jgi:hypothetical protein